MRLLRTLVVLFLVPLARADEPSGDALDEALGEVGLARGDLGWEPRGWWTRYPIDVPYRLRHFDDLLAEPLAVGPYLRGMGAAVREYLDPAGLDKVGVRGQRALSRGVHDLGVDRRFGGFRGYSANLTAPPTALADALLSIWRHARRPSRFVTFGEESPYPLVEEEVRAACAALPPEIGTALGKLVLDLLDAQGWAERAWRRTTLESRAAVARRPDIGAEETDALDYEPAADDLALAWDEASLWYAGLKIVEALDLARAALVGPAETHHEVLHPFRLDIATPLGRVLILGTEQDQVDLGSEGAWLAVDLGDSDLWRGAAGASTAERPIGVLLDLSGHDRYEGTDRTQGAGVAGVGVLYDAEGADSYRAEGALAQGAGQFGLGVLVDLGGDDQYFARYSAQGAGFFGVGCLFDLAGKDAYRIWSDGQGFGGVAGVGTLADRSGDDSYEAVTDPAVTKRPSYHTEKKVAVSNAQGCAMGRRGDGADGHSWAGGLGALLDAVGDDDYLAGNWAQGCGYWFGTGLLWDGAGNDGYRANGWGSASGAHFCIGAVVDEAGDDVREVTQDWGPAFGHDFTVALLWDLAGNDRYRAGASGIAHSINRSVVLLLDAGGNDDYALRDPQRRPGNAPFDPRYADRSGPSRYWTESTSVALFLDVGGTDAYAAGSLDDQRWTDPPESDNRRARNFGIGVDRAAGTIDLERPHGGRR
jgi:hypothetical protein